MTWRGPDHKWTDDDDERLLALSAEGLSQSVVAERMGRSKLSVAHRLRKLRREGRAEVPERDNDDD